MTENTVTERECKLCKEGLHLSIQQVSSDIKALRREMTLAVTVSTSLVGVFHPDFRLVIAEVKWTLKISVKKEKAVVFVGTVGAVISGYLVGMGMVAEGGILGAITTAIVAFWSEGINTE